MTAFLAKSAYWAVVLSLASYMLGNALKRRFKSAIINPILISVLVTVAFLLASGTKYSAYKASAGLISWLLTPATVCLAIPLYEQIQVLKSHWKGIVVGIVVGVLTSFVCVLALCLVFGVGHAQYVTLLPKSVTTAIGMDLSANEGGFVAITAVVIILTGIVGNIVSPAVLKVLHITEPVARGVAIGTSSHAIGTAKAFEIGPVEGAVSSLSIVVAGVLTVVEFLLVRNLI